MKKILTIAILIATSFPVWAIDYPIADYRVFAFAEGNYPGLFRGTSTAKAYDKYNYKYYELTGNYLAIESSGTISMLGQLTDNKIIVVGRISDFSDQIIAWEEKENRAKGLYYVGDIRSSGSIVVFVDDTRKHGLEVYPFDFNHGEKISSNYDDGNLTNEAVNTYSLGWRLPQPYELDLLFKNSNIAGLADEPYWDSLNVAKSIYGMVAYRGAELKHELAVAKRESYGVFRPTSEDEANYAIATREFRLRVVRNF